MRAIRTAIDVDATPAKVWEVMSNFAAWPDWNDVIDEMSVDPRVGGKVAFRIHLDGMPRLPIAAKMREWEPERALAWGAGVPGVFTGHHFFRIEPLGEDRTRVSHGEDFRGLLPAILLRGRIQRNIERTYERLNRQLKERAERDG